MQGAILERLPLAVRWQRVRSTPVFGTHTLPLAVQYLQSLQVLCAQLCVQVQH